MKFAGPGLAGKACSWLAGLFYPPYYGRVALSHLSPRGYISPWSTISHGNLLLGRHVFIDEGVLLYQDKDGGAIEIGDAAHLHRHSTLQTGQDGHIIIGTATHIQPRCQLSAYKGPITIGERVEIAPNCAFYSYNHGVSPESPIRQQPIMSKGGIRIGDDAWIGYGAIVLDGACIGKGAVVGAGSVVTGNIPDGGIAVGSPARVVRLRADIP